MIDHRVVVVMDWASGASRCAVCGEELIEGVGGRLQHRHGYAEGRAGKCGRCRQVKDHALHQKAPA